MSTERELVEDENRRIRHLRIRADLLVQTLMTGSLTMSEAEALISRFRELALTLFPGKDQPLELIYMPRFRRAMREAGLYRGACTLRILDGGKCT